MAGWVLLVGVAGWVLLVGVAGWVLLVGVAGSSPPSFSSADVVSPMSLMTAPLPPPIIPPAIQAQSSFTAFLLEVWDRLSLPTDRPQRRDKSMTPEVGTVGGWVWTLRTSWCAVEPLYKRHFG